MSKIKINRKYKNETTLVVGCGSNPSFCEKDHSHEYTIDMDNNVSPSLLADIRNCPLPLPSNVFSKVIFEGVSVRLSENKKLLKEIKRITTNDPYIDICFFTPGTYRHNKGYWDNAYNLPPFITFNDIQKMSSNELSILLKHKELTLDHNGFIQQ